MNLERNKEEKEIIDNINRIISELVYTKSALIKAYNYYHAKRDPEQFRHLEENYGIGTPTSVEFVPLTRKHIDVLVGEYLSTPLRPKISCKDKETLSNIFEEKEKAIHENVVLKLKKILRETLTNIASGKENQNERDLEFSVEEIAEKTSKEFISNYEIAAQNIIDWIMQSQVIDFLNKRKTLLIDLFVTGTCYYKSAPSPSNTNATIEVLNPLNTFVDRNPDSPYLKDSSRAVIRRFLTKDQILAKYGKWLSNDDVDNLQLHSDLSYDGSDTIYLRSFDDNVVAGETESSGILGGFEVTPLLPYDRTSSRNFRTIPVYEVEWLKTEKQDDDYIVNRYEGVRIGSDIYIIKGLSENVVRSKDNPKHCTLSINGIFYSDRNGEPYSLILKTANLQDKNDILFFYRDNLIAESGSAGDWLDVAHMPKFLGENVQERLLKWKAYKKSGIALYDSSQEGLPMVNTSFNGYDDTIKVGAIHAIDLAILRNEETCSMITGVFREKLGGIEQKDAVTNVQVGIRQSGYITKQYYQIMDLITREMLLDLLNITKITFKNGVSGTLILGEKLNKIFTALPEHYTVSDHDIHIADSADIIKEQEMIKQIGFELAKNDRLDPDILLDVITASGMTEMKTDVKAALDNKKKEANQLGQLSQQVEQLSQQLKTATSESEKLQREISRLNDEKIRLERERLQHEKEIEWFKAKDQGEFNKSKLDLDKKRIELEAAQLLDNNLRNDEIKNN